MRPLKDIVTSLLNSIKRVDGVNFHVLRSSPREIVVTWDTGSPLDPHSLESSILDIWKVDSMFSRVSVDGSRISTMSTPTLRVTICYVERLLYIGDGSA
jgi:hypothetical protein